MLCLSPGPKLPLGRQRLSAVGWGLDRMVGDSLNGAGRAIQAITRRKCLTKLRACLCVSASLRQDDVLKLAHALNLRDALS
jgi:hypothetical protein